MDDRLTTSEAASLLEVSPARIRQLVIGGRLEAIKRGRDLFVTRASVDAFERHKRGRKPATTTRGGDV